MSILSSEFPVTGRIQAQAGETRMGNVEVESVFDGLVFYRLFHDDRESQRSRRYQESLGRVSEKSL